MVTNLAKRVMTTNGQKACRVIDHLVEALGGDASSSLRRAMILVDIDQHPETSQADIMDRLQIHKSAVNREVEWLFNYGCIVMRDCANDGRAKRLQVCGYSKAALDDALNYFGGRHENVLGFLKATAGYLRQEKPTLREAKIVAFLNVHKGAEKTEIVKGLYHGSASTKNRVINKLVQDGVVADG
ncbi:MAG: MarR family transcriptional regulator [Alphaproteobacteria bacterium]